MKHQIRISIGLLTALFSIVGLFASSAAVADEDGNGCPSPEGRPTSNIVEASYLVAGNDTTYKFESTDRGGVAGEGVPGLIKYCVFPDPADENILPDTVVVDETPGTGAQGFDGSFFVDPQAPDAFSFDRDGGNQSNIPLDGTTRSMGTATWSAGAPADQLILLHINDEAECNDLGLNSETCFVLPGEIEEEPPADNLTVSKDAEPSFDRTFKWEIEKAVDKTKVTIADGGKATFEYTVTVTHDNGTDGGYAVVGTITVANTNSGEVTGVDIEDAINDANASCTVENGSNASIPAEGTEEFPYSCTYSDTPASESQTNTVEITWPQQTVDGALLVEGSAEGEAPVDWTTVVPGVIDGSIEVEDTLGGLLGTVASTDPSPTEFEYPYDFEGDPAGTCTSHNNVATFSSTDEGSETAGEAEKEVEVCVGADAEVEKTATPSFTRTFPWEIEKNVDKTSVTGQEGGNATFKYTINVIKGAGVDSDWLVKGTITVKNPNDFQTLEVDVADEIEAETNATCIVSGSEDAVIPISGSEAFEYECKYSAAPAGAEQTNKATATWDALAASTPTGSASGTAGIDWTAVSPTLVDNCLKEVTDTVDGVPTELAGEVCESTEYNPEVTYPIESGCVKHNNVAELITKDTEAKDSDSKEVEVCGFEDSGALTIGFWQNKNGQKIITDSGPSSGACTLTGWLRTYAPFQDLSATSTCKQAADYITKVIKSASSGGAAMNAMLKAQMLATALNVYFSDPALGGNKIKAPAPIGSFVVDLTKVCKNISTCSVFENTSAAFNGATSMSVSGLLSYAASQSNPGGTSWYGQVKATQELAKDTFDAINNEVAFGP